MNDMVIEVGNVLCRGALEIGIGGFRCYEQNFLLTLGLSAGAVLILAAVAVSKGLRRSA